MSKYTSSKTVDEDFGSSLGRHFAECIKRLDPEADKLVSEVCALVMQASENAHVCLPLADVVASLTSQGMDYKELADLLLASKFIGRPEDKTPVVLDDSNHLYLFRYWQYEKKLAEELLRRAVPASGTISSHEMGVILEKLFPQVSSPPLIDWQKIAVSVAFLQKFCVISGGPGTGKTTTVVKLLALLLEMSGTQHLRITLTAPTGKAAARLQEAIKRLKETLEISPEIIRLIPDEVPTIHRLLGSRRHSPHFRHDKRHPLALDVLVVDEASMVDLALMVKLLEALPSESRLVLLGDKDQLASIEAGRVLGDICCKGENFFSNEFSLKLQECFALPANEIFYTRQASALEDCLVILEKSYRFDDESGIGVLAKAINEGRAEMVLQCLQKGAFPDIDQVAYVSAANKKIIELVKDYGNFLDARTPKEAFREYNRFRILCVHRHGRFGVEEMNDWIEGILANQLCRGDVLWYAGRPVMITENDYNLGLFNGDTGITMLADDGELRVFFLDECGEAYSVAPFRLPAHQTSYAMTVHKSQGSEFDHVVLFLPEKFSPLLSRELLYTAVTRARKHFTLCGDDSVLMKGVERCALRNSGLGELLINQSYAGLSDSRNTENHMDD